MPAWGPSAGEDQAGLPLGVGLKAVTYFPANGSGPVPTINAGYLWFDANDGRLRAVFDGDELTARRTAAVSAAADLAAAHLAVSNSV